MENEYDKYYVVPKHTSAVRSRSDVDLRSGLYNLYPIMSSPMPGISGSKLVIEMARNNCLGILHRFGTLSHRYDEMTTVAKAGVPFGIAIGLGKSINDFVETELRLAEHAVDLGAVFVLLDVANGYIPQHEAVGNILRSRFPSVALGSGNVVTLDGANYLLKSGFNFIRVGIGGGACCTTRMKTGVGRNQIRALAECSKVDANIISDGGINEPGKAVKSFVAGADFVLLGSILAQSFEAEYDTSALGDNEGYIYGAASRTNHLNNEKEIKSVEGKDVKVKKIKPLKEIIDDFLWGVRSACTYTDSKHYSYLKYNAVLIGENE